MLRTPQWGGTNAQVDTSSTVGGHLNLMPGCRTTFAGSGTSQFITDVTLHNYGYAEYTALNSGLYLASGGQFWNEPGAIFNVTSTSGTDTTFSTADLVTSTFTNNGKKRKQSKHKRMVICKRVVGYVAELVMIALMFFFLLFRYRFNQYSCLCYLQDERPF